jgi:hypothetical protein
VKKILVLVENLSLITGNTCGFFCILNLTDVGCLKLIYLPQHEGMELQGDKHEIVLKMIT